MWLSSELLKSARNADFPNVSLATFWIQCQQKVRKLLTLPKHDSWKCMRPPPVSLSGECSTQAASSRNTLLSVLTEAEVSVPQGMGITPLFPSRNETPVITMPLVPETGCSFQSRVNVPLTSPLLTAVKGAPETAEPALPHGDLKSCTHARTHARSHAHRSSHF